MPVSGDWTYTESAGEATITDYSGAATPTIPTVLDGYPVVAIAGSALQNKSLISVTIEHAINLNNYCFQGNTGLSVILDADVTTTGVDIGTPPFQGCAIGSGLTLTSNCTTIPKYLFEDSGLTEVSFPSSVVYLDSSSFRLNNISTLVLPSTIETIFGSVFRESNITNLTINCDCDINSAAFVDNSGINVTLNASPVYIGNSLYPPFEGCAIGSGLTINAGCTSIGSYMFKNCGLTEITLDHEMNLGAECFANNTGINVVLDSYVTTTGVGGTTPPFENCAIGSGLTITSNISIIQNYLFYNAGLTSVTIPSSITAIGSYTFKNNSISSLELNYPVDLYTECFANNVGMDVTINANLSTTAASSSNTPFEGCSIGSGATITSNVTALPSYLFCYCGLTSIVVPDTVVAFNSYQFAYNYSLETLYIYSLSFTASNTLAANTPSSGMIYGYAGSSAETLANAYAAYDFTALVDITMNMDAGLITFSGKEPTIQIPITVNMDVGLITFAGKDLTMNTTVNMETGSITFAGKDITTIGGDVITTDSGVDGMNLFLLADFIQ